MGIQIDQSRTMMTVMALTNKGFDYIQKNNGDIEYVETLLGLCKFIVAGSYLLEAIDIPISKEVIKNRDTIRKMMGF